MNDFYKVLFNKQPDEMIRGDYYFHADMDGDCFDENNVRNWMEDGAFRRAWKKGQNAENEMAPLYAKACEVFAERPSPFLEIACGPGMGLAPLLLTQYPKTLCLATDACSLLIKSWRQYIDGNLSQYDISLASFSVFDMPLRENSLSTVTSYIGVSSTRAGEQGQIKALREIYRVLKSGGYFIAIENEWTNLDAIKRVFYLWGMPIWDGLQNLSPWKDKFMKCGFIVENDEKSCYHKLSKTDNELGEQADKFGIAIGQTYTLYILRKP